MRRLRKSGVGTGLLGKTCIRLPGLLTGARKWSRILKQREYWEQLQPGRPLLFDNWRVLHGRSSFTGNRRMCGGYSMYRGVIMRSTGY